jgi:AraC-like DNA-binding protein
VRWIRDHYTQSFRVQDVAQLAGMSVSAFHRNFQPVTTTSPIQFQEQICLQEARLLLARTKATSRASATASVTTAPRSSAASTARKFGVLPSQDGGRLSGPAPSVAPSLPLTPMLCDSGVRTRLHRSGG